VPTAAGEGDRRVTYLPFGLGARDESRKLYITYVPSSSSLFRPNQDFSDRLIIEQITRVVGEETIRLTTLDAALKHIGEIDFIKLDAEGAELDIMKGGRKSLSVDGVLGIFTEVRWHRAMGTPIFSEVDLLVREFGFELYDVALGRTSRKALPYPLTWDFRHEVDPNQRIYGSTVLGQVLGGDALYLRDLGRATGVRPTKLLKLACLMEIFEQRDSAAELLLANRPALEGIVDVGGLLNTLAAGMADQRLSYDEYIRTYYEKDFGFRPGAKTMVQAERPLGRIAAAVHTIGRFVRSIG
jgi:FkbM family methyltransferase